VIDKEGNNISYPDAIETSEGLISLMVYDRERNFSAKEILYCKFRRKRYHRIKRKRYVRKAGKTHADQ
jgi:hypothetical protein